MGQVPRSAMATASIYVAAMVPGARRSSSSRLPGDDALDGDEGAAAGVGEGGEFSAAADPDVAGGVGHDGVEGGDVGVERGNEEDLVGFGGEGVLDDAPIRAVRDEVAAEDAAEGHEGHSLLGSLQPGVDGGAGGVGDAEGAGGQGGGEARGPVRLHRG